MKIGMGIALAAIGLSGSMAAADSTLQFDINAFAFQVRDGMGNNSPFAGLNHTGSVNFAAGANTQLDLATRIGDGNPFIDQGFSGSVSGFSGSIQLVNGVVSGGSLNLQVNGGADSYAASIVAGSGDVDTFAGGGFTIDGLTFAGTLSDALFGNVDVSTWFNSGNGALTGSYLQFNFNPNAVTGAGFADMDAFVTVPLPTAGLAGMSGLAGLMGVGALRRRR